MKPINLNLPYRVMPGDSAQTCCSLSHMIIAGCVQACYPQRMDRDASRLWASILDKLQDAQDTLELEETEFAWLFEKIDRAELPVMFSSYLWAMRRHLAEIANGGESKAKLRKV